MCFDFHAQLMNFLSLVIVACISSPCEYEHQTIGASHFLRSLNWFYSGGIDNELIHIDCPFGTFGIFSFKYVFYPICNMIQHFLQVFHMYDLGLPMKMQGLV